MTISRSSRFSPPLPMRRADDARRFCSRKTRRFRRIMNNLRELQILVYQLITRPDRLNGGGHVACPFPDVEPVIRTSRNCADSERIAIYANAYFYRLLDCLMEDYPATLAVIGSTDFTGVTRDYLVSQPPTEPSIFHAGRNLAHFLWRHSISRRWPFIAELARLERATLEA